MGNHEDFLKLLDSLIFEIATMTTESYFLFRLLGEQFIFFINY